MGYYIRAFLSDPRATLMVILLALPGRMLAMSMHEAAHAYVADRCGDPTARNLGRLTLNPFKHIDILGFLMLYLVGFGWAKPCLLYTSTTRASICRLGTSPRA